MKQIYDRAAMAKVLALNLNPGLRELLERPLPDDFIDWTEWLIFEPGDTEADILRHFGFSPLIEPFDGIRYGQAGFWPHWDHLARHGDVYELIATFGSTFAYILLIPDAEGIDQELLQLCREYGR